MVNGIVRYIRDENLLKQGHPLHEERDKESIEITGQLLPQHACGGQTWCVEVKAMNEDDETKLERVAIGNRAVALYLDGVGYGEVAHVEPVIKLLSSGEERFYKCLGQKALRRANKPVPTEVIDEFIEEIFKENS